MKKKKFYLTIECYEYQNGQRVGTEKCYATTSYLYSVTTNIKEAKIFTEYMANKLLSNPLNKGWKKEEVIEGE